MYKACLKIINIKFKIMLNFVLRSWGWGRRSMLAGSVILTALFFISSCFVSYLGDGYTHGHYILHVHCIL